MSDGLLISPLTSPTNSGAAQCSVCTVHSSQCCPEKNKCCTEQKKEEGLMWSNALDCANLDAVKCALKFSWVQMREVESDVTFVRRIAQQRVGPQQRHTYILCTTYMVNTYAYIIRMAHWEGSGTYVVTSQYVEQYPLHDDRKTCERRKSQYVSHLGVKGWFPKAHTSEEETGET